MTIKQKQKVTLDLDTPLILLTLIFIILKFAGEIDWSWWWVLAPLWLPFAVIFGFIALAAAGLAIWFLLQVGSDLIRQSLHNRQQRKGERR